MKYKRTSDLWIKAIDKDGGYIENQDVETNLLYDILMELRERNKR